MGRPTPPPVHAPGGWRGPPSSAVKRVTDPSTVQGALRQQLSTRGALQSRLVPNGGMGRCGWRPTGAAAQGWGSTVRSTGQGEGRHRRSRRRAPVGWREGDGNGGWTAGPTRLCLPLLLLFRLGVDARTPSAGWGMLGVADPAAQVAADSPCRRRPRRVANRNGPVRRGSRTLPSGAPRSPVSACTVRTVPMVGA